MSMHGNYKQAIDMDKGIKKMKSWKAWTILTIVLSVSPWLIIGGLKYVSIVWNVLFR